MLRNRNPVSGLRFTEPITSLSDVPTILSFICRAVYAPTGLCVIAGRLYATRPQRVACSGDPRTRIYLYTLTTGFIYEMRTAQTLYVHGVCMHMVTATCVYLRIGIILIHRVPYSLANAGDHVPNLIFIHNTAVLNKDIVDDVLNHLLRLSNQEIWRLPRFHFSTFSTLDHKHGLPRFILLNVANNVSRVLKFFGDFVVFTTSRSLFIRSRTLIFVKWSQRF